MANNANPALACALPVEPGCLVEYTDGDWHIWKGESLRDELPELSGATIAAIRNNTLRNLRVLLPPAHRLDAAGKLAALEAAGWRRFDILPHWELRLEAGVMAVKQDEDGSVNPYRYVADAASGGIYPATLDAHMRDMQKYAALVAWLAAQPKEAKDGQ